MRLQGFSRVRVSPDVGHVRECRHCPRIHRTREDWPMSVFGNTASFGDNRLFENIRFRGDVDRSLNQTDPGIGSVRIRAALDNVDLGRLSPLEKNVLLAQLDVLGSDGAISNDEADAVLASLEQFEAGGGSD